MTPDTCENVEASEETVPRRKRDPAEHFPSLGITAGFRHKTLLKVRNSPQHLKRVRFMDEDVAVRTCVVFAVLKVFHNATPANYKRTSISKSRH